MNNIENIDQLQAEIKRLRVVAKQQEKQLRTDFAGIREDLRPQNIALNLLSSATGIKMNKNEFFKDGIAFGLSLLIQRFVLKSERKMESKVYDLVDSVVSKVKYFVEKFTSSTAKKEERESAKHEFNSEE